MAVGESSSSTATRDLQETPTWAVATVCFGLILVSIILEHSIHLITNWVKKHKKKSLEEAMEKLKAELMLLGFISLILTVVQGPISSICIPSKYANIMLPCSSKTATNTEGKLKVTQHLNIKTGNLFHFINGAYEDGPWHSPHRLLASESGTTTCSDGKVPMVSQEGIHQLHILIFVLAASQLVCSLLTMALGRAKMGRWKAWEEETRSISYQVAYDPARYRLTRDTTFGKRHLGIWTKSIVLLWIKCFFRQFFHSLEKVDYFTLRHGFINAHMPTNSYFNFRKYIQRSLEDDFKVVVGISPVLWMVVVILLLVDVKGAYVFFWMPYVPFVILLVLGTKLEVILARMAMQLTDQATVTLGAPLVQPDDKLFWFSKPKFVLSLLHFTMFANAFELSFTLWAMWQFGSSTCFNGNIVNLIARLMSALIVVIISSYITLPIYALVTQMGSKYKSAVLGEEAVDSVMRWYTRAKKKKPEDPSSHRPLISHPNSEMDSSWRTTATETSPTQRRQHTTTLEEIISSPSEVQQKPGDQTSAPSESMVVELSGWSVTTHDKPALHNS